MKVWMNKRQGDYTGELLLVAANSEEGAHALKCAYRNSRNTTKNVRNTMQTKCSVLANY